MYKANINIEVTGLSLEAVQEITGVIYNSLQCRHVKDVEQCDLEVTYEKNGEYVGRDETSIEVTYDEELMNRLKSGEKVNSLEELIASVSMMPHEESEDENV